MPRGVISPDIPYFKRNRRSNHGASISLMGQAHNAIEGSSSTTRPTGLTTTAANQELVDKARRGGRGSYNEMVYPTMEINWTTHPDNVGHKDWAGLLPLPRRQAS